MKKRNVKIVYQYDGSKFCGFQRQMGIKTVQGEIEKVISKTFFQNINMISSGRTDKGVHAIEQVSNFMIDQNIPLNAIKRQLNKRLKGEIKILDIEEMDEKFNSRFDAQNRTYLYIMKVEDEITPFETNYITGIKEMIDIDKFQKIMSEFIGKHDFSSFMKKDKAYRNPVREIFFIKCYYDEKDKKNRINILQIINLTFCKWKIKTCSSPLLKKVLSLFISPFDYIIFIFIIYSVYYFYIFYFHQY